MVVKIETNINEKMNEWSISTPFIETVLKLIEATYKDNNYVEVLNPTKSNDLEKVSNFFEYILKYPITAKVPKVIVKEGMFDENIDNKVDVNISDTYCICFSGGIDSTGALLHLIERGKKVVALWCDYGQPYNKSEKECVLRICNKLKVELFIATVDLSPLIALDNGRFKHVFPARNLLIASIAAALNPKEIVLAGLSDELMVPDKSPRMYLEGSELLNYKIYSPFMKMTKAEVLSVWKKRWNNMLDALETVSCYGKNGNCQDCSSCAKREVALVASDYTNKFPIVFTNQSDLIAGHWFSRIDIFDIPRRSEILISLNKYLDKITPELREKTMVNYKKYKIEVDSWKKHIDDLEDIVEV